MTGTITHGPGVQIGERQRLINAWRYTLATIDDHLIMIPMHLRCLAEGRERPEYLGYVTRILRERLAGYRQALQRRHFYETLMVDAGVEYRARGR